MAAFAYAKKYEVNGICISPLRTGGTSGDNTVVLVNNEEEQIPMIQGTSIAGVLRSYLSKADAEALFGSSNSQNSTDQTSKVSVSDALFHEYHDHQFRPRLRMNRDTGAGENRKKFELAILDAGSAFSFTLLLKTDAYSPKLEEKLEQALGALNSGILTLGGQTSNGFGEVSLTVTSHSFDLRTSQGREDWLSNAKCSTPVELPKVQKPEGVILFCLDSVCPNFLIKSGSNKREALAKDAEKSRSVTSAMCRADGRYVLPASALKGVLRNRAEAIAAYKNASPDLEALFGRGNEGFDDNGKPGLLRVKEYTLEHPKSKTITRTRLDRFTGGVLNQSLFTEETLSDHIQICIEVAEENKNGCALLFYALRDLALGLYGFGSETSVGRGILQKKHSKLTIQKGNKHCVLTFDGKGTISGDTSFLTDWLNSLDHTDKENQHE